MNHRVTSNVACFTGPNQETPMSMLNFRSFTVAAALATAAASASAQTIPTDFIQAN